MTAVAGRTPPEPVIVVGAGPVGLAAALMLARCGVASVVLERHPAPYDLPRAVHADDEVARILQQLGLDDDFAAISRPAAGLRLLTADHRVMAEFRRDGLGSAGAGVHGHPQSSLFDQPDLERLLRGRVAADPLVELHQGVEVVDVRPGGAETAAGAPTVARVRVRPTGAGPVSVLVAPAVLGCDGAGSTVRGALGIEVDDLGFEERWLVVDVRCPVPLPVWDGVEQVCDPHRAATAMRVGADRYRWEFRMHPGETVAELSVRERLAALLAPWMPAGPAPPLTVVRIADYTFRARLARRWRHGPVFLLGDAAHETPPFVGQGLGSGLRDVANLGWKLARVLHGGDGARQDERLLDSYEAERRPHARSMIRLARLAGWAMTGGQDRAAAVRRLAVGALVRVPGAREELLRRTGPPLRAGALVHRTHGRWRDPAGHLVPQPWVGVGGRRRRLDDLLGSGFALVCDGPPDDGARGVAERFAATVIRVDTLEGSAPLTAWLARHRARAVLVRPDRVVHSVLPRRDERAGLCARSAPATVPPH